MQRGNKTKRGLHNKDKRPVQKSGLLEHDQGGDRGRENQHLACGGTPVERKAEGKKHGDINRSAPLAEHHKYN